MKRLFSYLILLLPFFGFAQSPQFNWSQTLDIEGEISLSFQINDTTLITSKNVNGGVVRTNKIEQIKLKQGDEKVSCSVKIIEDKLVKSLMPSEFWISGDNIIRFTRQENLKGSKLLIDKLDNNFTVLKSAEFESGFNTNSNERFLMMYRLKDLTLEVKMIDLEGLEIVSENSIDIPLDYDRIEIIDILLDNDGSALFGIAPMKSLEKGKKTKDKKDGEFMIVSVNGTSHEIYSTKIADAHLNFGDFVELNDDIFFVGVTSNGFDQDNLYTLRSFKLNGGENSIEEVGSNDCSGDFLYSGLSDDEKKNLSGKFENYKKENVFNIPERGVRSYMQCAEQIGKHKVLMFSLNNAFLVCSLDDNGNFSWLKSIPLNYVSGGMGYSNADNELIFYFTDASTNYDESGRFKLNYKKSKNSDRIRGREDVGVKLTIDMLTGDYERELLDDLKGYSISFPLLAPSNAQQLIIQRNMEFKTLSFGIIDLAGMKMLIEY